MNYQVVGPSGSYFTVVRKDGHVVALVKEERDAQRIAADLNTRELLSRG